MGEPPRDGKKNDVQREDEIRRLQEMVSSLQVGVEELKKKPRKGSRKLKRRPSRGDEAKDDDEAAPTPAAAPAPPGRALPAKTNYVSFTARGRGRVEIEQSRGAAEEPESIEELTHRSLESIHDSKGHQHKKGSFLLHKARKPKLDEKVNAEHAPFPKQPRRPFFPVQDPRTDARFGWDVWLMVLIFYVMLVTPFQISFTRAPDDFVDNFTAGDPPGYNKYIVLAVLNGVVDIMFFADLCLCFNTAFFEDNEWVVSRRRIAVNYVCSWFVLDLLSILPYQLISTRSGFLKMIRMVRLMKMLRVLKQPRIMARIAARNTMRAGQQAVCKYIAILLFLLHWTACAIRMIAAVTLDDCHKKRGGLENWRPDSDCAMTVLARFWNRGIWAQYVDALTWALGTLQGDFFTTNVAEQVLCLIVGLVGCIVMAFLIGDLCNVVGNMDPVGNDYTMTLDMLNSYLDEQNTPPALRMKLREYMGLAEKTFRDEQHKRILERLSPTLKAIVAHQNLGREVARIGFYEQAVRRTFRLYPGTRCAVYPKSKNRQDRPGPPRPCVITHVDDALLFSVRYDDDQSEEHDLVHSRVDVHSYELGFAFERDINRFIYEHDNFVLAVSHLLSTKFFMDRDFLIHQNMTPNEEMYVIQNGRCICWGEKRRQATGVCFARISPEAVKKSDPVARGRREVHQPHPLLQIVLGQDDHRRGHLHAHGRRQEAAAAALHRARVRDDGGLRALRRRLRGLDERRLVLRLPEAHARLRLLADDPLRLDQALAGARRPPPHRTRGVGHRSGGGDGRAAGVPARGRRARAQQARRRGDRAARRRRGPPGDGRRGDDARAAPPRERPRPSGAPHGDGRRRRLGPRAHHLAAEDRRRRARARRLRLRRRPERGLLRRGHMRRDEPGLLTCRPGPQHPCLSSPSSPSPPSSASSALVPVLRIVAAPAVLAQVAPYSGS